MAKNSALDFLNQKKRQITAIQQNQEITSELTDFQQFAQNFSTKEGEVTEVLNDRVERLIDLLQQIKASSHQRDEAGSNKILNNLIKAFAPQGVVEVDVNAIEPITQPRVTFTSESLERLARSIESEGQLVPIILIPLPNGQHKIFDGERRWRSICELLKRATIKAIILPNNTSNLYRRILIANIHREDLNALDKAEAIVAEIRATNPGLDSATIVTRLRAVIRRDERAATPNQIGSWLQLPQTEQQAQLDQFPFKDEVEKTIIQTLVGLQLNPSTLLRAVFPALNLPVALKQAIRERSLGVAQALAINGLSAEKLNKLDRDRALEVIEGLSEQIISQRLSIRATKALIKDTIALYSQAPNSNFKNIQRWLNNFDEDALTGLNSSELEELQQSLAEKLDKVQTTLKKFD